MQNAIRRRAYGAEEPMLAVSQFALSEEQVDISGSGSESQAGSSVAEYDWLHPRFPSKKARPHKAPRMGTISDAVPGIVFKLYPTVISKTVSDYVMHVLSNNEGQGLLKGTTVGAGSGNGHGSSGNIGPVKRRHSLKPKHLLRSEEDDENVTRRMSEQLVLRKEVCSDSEFIDILGESQTTTKRKSPGSNSGNTGSSKRSALSSSQTSVASTSPNSPQTLGITSSRRPSHIVSNRLLMTTSRRISASGVVDGRFCASCDAAVTPYWRDGWNEELMLCNACGLRFQKFLKRCASCSYIPRKEDNELPNCPHCHDEWV